MQFKFFLLVAHCSCLLRLSSATETFDEKQESLWYRMDMVALERPISRLELKLMTYNVNRFWKAEEFAHLKWDNRVDKIVETVKKVNPDILAIQEIAHLNDAESIQGLYYRLSSEGYRCDEFYCNANLGSMGVATCYKQSRLFRTEVLSRWLSPNPLQSSDFAFEPGWGHIVGISILHPTALVQPPQTGSPNSANAKPINQIDYSSPPLIVFNTHFSRNSKAQHHSIPILASIINSMGHDASLKILIGDFNMYSQVKLQRLSSFKYFLPDCKLLTDNAILSSSGKEALGTWVGYPYDRCVLKSDENVGSGSPLDAIFVCTRRNFIHFDAMISDNVFKVVKDSKIFPSDHLALSVSIVVENSFPPE